MKRIILKSLRLFLTTALASIMCFFLVISLNVIKVSIFTEVIGWQVYGTVDEAEKPEYLYTHYTKDGDDNKADEYEKEGYKLTMASIRSEVDDGIDTFIRILTQVLCFLIIILLIYGRLWQVGNDDRQAEKLHGIKENKFKGFYIGLLTVSPVTLFLIFAIITKNTVFAEMPVTIFTFFNSYAYEILLAVNKNTATFADVGLLQIILYFAIILIIPLTAMVSYIIGHKDIVILDKLIYKKAQKKEIK